MGAIKGRLRAVALYIGKEEKMLSQLDYAGEAIESEFQKQDKKIEELKKDMLDVYEMLAQRTKRIDEAWKEILSLNDRAGATSIDQAQRTKSIEALEKEVRLLRSDVKYLATYILTPEESVPTDKDGKPLEPGDVISYTILDKDSPYYEKKILIQFAGKETDHQYRYWQNLNSGTRDAFCYNGFISKDRVTFEFRPRFPEKR